MFLKCKINLAILISICMLAGCNKQSEELKTASEPKPSSAETVNVDEHRDSVSKPLAASEGGSEVESIISQIKKDMKLPNQVNPDIRWDDIKYDQKNRTVFYTYTLAKVDTDVTNEFAQNNIEEQMKAQAIRLCAEPLTKAMLKNNILMGYSYFGPDDKKVGSFTFDLRRVCR